MFKGLSYGRVIAKDGNDLLRVSYTDHKGARVEILIKPNPTGASKLLSVNWGGKAVDPLPYDNIAVLDVEARLRVADRNVAELEGIKFCSLWTFESRLQPEIQKEKDSDKWEMIRTQNMADRKYLFGRLWRSNDLFRDVVYWTRHFERDKDKPIAWLAVESGVTVAVGERHQKEVDKLFQLITEHDARVRLKEG
jgi:hypothetical protein